jgi:transcriptional regulator with XRE-family HTH domain
MTPSPSAPAVTFPERLRYWRRRRRLTQKQLAARCGCSQAAISLTEAGIRQPLARTVLKLADALRVSPGRLLGSDP